MTIDRAADFAHEVAKSIEALRNDERLKQTTLKWIQEANSHKYTYNFRSLGRPIIQFPQDIIAVQELIWDVRPDLIIETGIAHGGSLILSASILTLLDYCDAVQSGQILDPCRTHRRVLGIDIDIRAHNRAAIEAHPMSHRIDMIQGSSVAAEIVAQVHKVAADYQQVLVILDSNHTHEHVLAELEAYAPLIGTGGYCIVFDTLIEDLPASMFPDRPWGPGNSPKTAVREYLRRLRDEGRSAADGSRLNLEVDRAIESKLLITVAPEGYLRRT